jgi:hypothetical protein
MSVWYTFGEPIFLYSFSCRNLQKLYLRGEEDSRSHPKKGAAFCLGDQTLLLGVSSGVSP